LLNKPNNKVEVEDILEAMYYFIDRHDTKREVKKEEKNDEDLNNLEELELNKEVVDINSIDIMALINSTEETIQDASTEDQSKRGLDLFDKCELNNAVPNKVFLDWNKIQWKLYDNKHTDAIESTLRRLKLPGLNRFRMPLIPQIPVERRKILACELTPFLKGISLDAFRY